MLCQIGIKNHFPLKSLIACTVKSLPNVAALDWMLLTAANRDVSSAKSLQLEDTPFDKSLM